MEQHYQFAVGGRRFRATRGEVERALEGVIPETVRKHSVGIGGRRYPVKQAFSVAFGVDRVDFTTPKARRVFQHLGFEVSRRKDGTPDTSPAEQDGPRVKEPRRKRAAAGDVPRARETRRSWAAAGWTGGVRPRFPYMAQEPPAAEVEGLPRSGVVLRWSPWERWEAVAADGRGGKGVKVPAGRSGVYEVAVEGEAARLAIGRTSDLRRRVRVALVRGRGAHPAGDRIRAREDTSRLLVRWALTDRPAAVEEELHERHIRKHGALPKHTKHT